MTCAVAALGLWALAAPPGALHAAPTQFAPASPEAALHDYIDGQLEGDADRVSRALHPDLAKRAALPANSREAYPLRRMTADELIELTRRAELKTPEDQRERSITIVFGDENVVLARIETPWFVDHLQLARFGQEWLIVNALWVPATTHGEQR